MQDIYCRECGESLTQFDQQRFKELEPRLDELKCEYCGSTDVDVIDLSELA